MVKKWNDSVLRKWCKNVAQTFLSVFKKYKKLLILCNLKELFISLNTDRNVCATLVTKKMGIFHLTQRLFFQRMVIQ